jgi:hypothetical protein
MYDKVGRVVDDDETLKWHLQPLYVNETQKCQSLVLVVVVVV